MFCYLCLGLGPIPLSLTGDEILPRGVRRPIVCLPRLPGARRRPFNAQPQKGVVRFSGRWGGDDSVPFVLIKTRGPAG
jgi:hypothetical protein